MIVRPSPGSSLSQSLSPFLLQSLQTQTGERSSERALAELDPIPPFLVCLLLTSMSERLPHERLLLPIH